MNNFKIKLGVFSLLAILAVSVFLTSCEQAITNNLHEVNAIDHSLLTEDELLTKLNSDEDAMAFANATEKFEEIMKTALSDQSTSVDMLRNHYNAQDEIALEALFGNTEFLAVHNEMEYYAERFLQKFPGIEGDLAKFATHESNAPMQEYLLFSTLETDITMRGCRCCGTNWWLKKVCQGFCIANGVACTSLFGPYVCGLAGYSCVEACDWYYCEYL